MTPFLFYSFSSSLHWQCLIIYSVAVINLPINTIKTAGIAIPINGTKIEGKRLGKSDGIVL